MVIQVKNVGGLIGENRGVMKMKMGLWAVILEVIS